MLKLFDKRLHVGRRMVFRHPGGRVKVGFVNEMKLRISRLENTATGECVLMHSFLIDVCPRLAFQISENKLIASHRQFAVNSAEGRVRNATVAGCSAANLIRRVLTQSNLLRP